MAEHLPATDPKTNQFLVQASEGTPCKFSMIAKGTEILRLIVFREGTYRSQVQVAKQEGHQGPAYWGVVTGDGSTITFHLCSRDGFSKPPVDETIASAFLVNKAELTIAAAFEIADELPPVPDPAEHETTGMGGDQLNAERQPEAGFGSHGETSSVPAPIAAEPPSPEPVAEQTPPPEPVAADPPPPEPVADQPQSPEPIAADPPSPEPVAEQPPPPPTEPAVATPKDAPHSDAAMTRAEMSEARRRALQKIYRALPDPLKYTTLDSAIGPCTKYASDQRYTADAYEDFSTLINEAADWLRSEASDHPEHTNVVREIIQIAQAERVAITKAMAEEATGPP